MNKFGRTFTQGEPVGKDFRNLSGGSYRSIGRKDDAVKNIWTSGNLLASGLPGSFFSRGSSPLAEHNATNIANIIRHVHSGTKFDMGYNSKNHKSRNLPT